MYVCSYASLYASENQLAPIRIWRSYTIVSTAECDFHMYNLWIATSAWSWTISKGATKQALLSALNCYKLDELLILGDTDGKKK